MQTKNVNLLQSKAEAGVPASTTSGDQSETSTATTDGTTATATSSASVVGGSPAPSRPTSSVAAAPGSSSSSGAAPPPLPPRSSSQLPPRPATSHYASSSVFPPSGDNGRLYSPYKPVPLPKPVPPPYRQPPHHLTNGNGGPSLGGHGAGGGTTPPTHPRLNNIETAAVLMPGSLADVSATYVTHSAKFPIKREQAAYSNVGQLQAENGGGEGPTGDEYGIPTLNEVMRVKQQQQQQRPRSVNAILPEVFQQFRPQQAWTEDSKNPAGAGSQEGIQQKLRSLLQHSQPVEPAYGVGGGRPGDRRVPTTAPQDEGEPLLVRSRSGPVYPLGIDNQGLDHGDVGYVPSEPHQRAEGARGQVLLERRPQTTGSSRELYGAGTYRATVATTVGSDYRSPSEDTGGGGGRPSSSASGENRVHLRDACSRMYTTRQPATSGKPTLPNTAQNYQGSAMSLQSIGSQPLNGEENPYWSRQEMTTEGKPPLPQTAEGRSSRSGEPRAPEGDSSRSPGSNRPSSNGEPSDNHRGPHRYYHLRDMTSGGNHDQPGKREAQVEIDMNPPPQVIYGSTQSPRLAPATDGDIYVTSRVVTAGQQPQEGGQRSGYAEVAAETDAAQPKAPLSPSSTSSESGHGTMRTGGGPSVQSGSLSSGTLATSFESDVYSSGRPTLSNEVAGGASTTSEQRSKENGSSSLGVENAPVSGRTSRQQRQDGWDGKNGSRGRLGDGNVSGAGGAFDEMEDSMEELARDRFLNYMSRREVGGTTHESTFSDSFSVTPPLPPLSPSNSPPPTSGGGRLPSKYKMSLSVGSLHKTSSTTPDILETTREGSMQNLKEANSRLLAKKSAARQKNAGGGEMRSWALRNKQQFSAAGAPSGGGLNGGKYVPLHCRVPQHQTKGASSPYTQSRTKGSQMSLGAGMSFDSHDGDVTSTTTGLDMESLLDDVSTDDASSRTSQPEGSEINVIRRQLESLEGMYSEVMKMLGVKGAHGPLNGGRSLHDLRPSRRKVFGSLTSLTSKGTPGTPAGRSGVGSKDRQSQNDRKRNRDTKSVGRRFQRLESHVVTLARSVAHLSSEMRTQHIMFQELENLRQEVAQLHDQHQAALRGGRPGQGAGAGGAAGAARAAAAGGAALREWDNFRCSVPSLTNPGRVKKLTNFFGDEPPLLRLFLKKLGYEKYALQFETEKIGIIELPYLTEERLQKIGIPMGPRMRILQEAQMSFRQEHFNIYIV